MRSVVLAIALLASGSGVASAQYVFGGCPQPNVTGFAAAPKVRSSPCVAPVDEKGDAARACGVILGGANDVIASAPEVTARITKDRDGRRTGIELRVGGRTLARWRTDDQVDCTSRIFLSPDRKTVAVEIRLDEMTLDVSANPHQLVVFRLARSVPAPAKARN